MLKRKFFYFFLSISIIIILILYYFFTEDKEKITIIEQNKVELENKNEIYTSNIIENVSYNAKDRKGNIYKISALEGEIDVNNSDIIFLKNVKSIIKLKNSEKIIITSKFGKYNIVNFDTIFSKKVLIKYLDNTISSEYLDFSIDRDSIIVTKNVIYKNINNILKADVMEMNLTTKNIKIYMLSDNKKVNIKNRN